MGYKLSPADIQLIEATKPHPQPCCIIPARKGSKRIKGKNKRLLNGRPLVDYALRAAIDSGVFCLIVVSSDDMDILEHTYSYFDTGIVQPHKRPRTLCGDNVPVRVAVRYAIQSYLMKNVICLLQPTNPLITAKQIKDAYDVFTQEEPNYLIGMCRGQDVGFHFFKRDIFLGEYEQNFRGTNWIPFEVEGIDIDTEEDWSRAEELLKCQTL